MLKKIYNIIFIVAFLAVIATPLVLTDFSSGGISEDENRTLAAFPALTVEGKWNSSFTGEFETWFMDHLGLRQKLITTNATLQFRVFDRMLDKSNYHIGRNGDINYADGYMLLDYAHMNLRTEEEVAKIGQSYQTISDWFEERDIPFYYVQCYDKHSIYPEQFTDAVKQVGDVSKTDQVIQYLKAQTTVNTVSLKEPLLAAKEQYEVYSNWGDPTHWTPRGAFLGYQYIMEQINADREVPLRVLQEEDYEITTYNAGITLNQVVHEDDFIEAFAIRAPKAARVDKSVMGKWAEDERHSAWKNPEAGSDAKLLLMCDSYINSFIVADLAESFSEVWLVWGDYTGDLPELTEIYQPDVVIYECAERVDRSEGVCAFAEELRAEFP